MFLIRFTMNFYLDLTYHNLKSYHEICYLLRFRYENVHLNSHYIFRKIKRQSWTTIVHTYILHIRGTCIKIFICKYIFFEDNFIIVNDAYYSYHRNINVVIPEIRQSISTLRAKFALKVNINTKLFLFCYAYLFIFIYVI